MSFAYMSSAEFKKRIGIVKMMTDVFKEREY
jgi:hypothetical protein